jgi:hypothetical protein
VVAAAQALVVLVVLVELVAKAATAVMVATGQAVAVVALPRLAVMRQVVLQLQLLAAQVESDQILIHLGRLQLQQE